MARPRTVSDEEILAATARVVTREGPLRFTLEQVGKEAGVSAPAVLKRFGTKRALLLAFAASAPGGVERAFERAREEARDPLAALQLALQELATGLTTPAHLANGLAFLAIDVTDPDFREHARAFFHAFHEGTRARLAEAQARGDLARAADAAALARAVEVAFHGALIRWGIRQEGGARAALAEDVEAVLAPFTRKRRGRAAPIPPGPRLPGAGPASPGT